MPRPNIPLNNVRGPHSIIWIDPRYTWPTSSRRTIACPPCEHRRDHVSDIVAGHHLELAAVDVAVRPKAQLDRKPQALFDVASDQVPVDAPEASMRGEVVFLQTVGRADIDHRGGIDRSDVAEEFDQRVDVRIGVGTHIVRIPTIGVRHRPPQFIR